MKHTPTDTKNPHRSRRTGRRRTVGTTASAAVVALAVVLAAGCIRLDGNAKLIAGQPYGFQVRGQYDDAGNPVRSSGRYPLSVRALYTVNAVARGNVGQLKVQSISFPAPPPNRSATNYVYDLRLTFTPQANICRTVLDAKGAQVQHYAVLEVQWSDGGRSDERVPVVWGSACALRPGE